jgi:hypothetical protein
MPTTQSGILTSINPTGAPSHSNINFDVFPAAADAVRVRLDYARRALFNGESVDLPHALGPATESVILGSTLGAAAP